MLSLTPESKRGNWAMSKAGFLTRLKRDPSGNTLAIAAASIIPIIGMVGGAVDLSRYYMTASRMQNACDAGALAARKNMGDSSWTTEDETMGLDFFDQNYPTGTFGLDNLQRSYTADSDGTVTGTASGDLPLSLMHIFGYDEFDVSVSCTAEINISNTDIMFVLDVTGSMNCSVTSTSCTNNGNVEAGNAKIKALRSAVLDFYDTVESATSSSAQVRYGIVPYSSNVNVGGSIPTAYMATSHTYQSREAQWDISWDEVSLDLTNTTNYGSSNYQNFTTNAAGYVSESYCSSVVNNYASNVPESYMEGSINIGSASNVVQSVSGGIRTTIGNGATITLRRGDAGYTYSSGYCRVGNHWYERSARSDFTLIEEENKDFDEWEYKPVTFDLSDLYDDNYITLPVGNSGSDRTLNWEGCIEEVDTVTTGTFDPLPSGANDLKINLIPSSNATRWRPQLPDLVYNRRNGSGNTTSTVTTSSNSMNQPSHYCPKAAMKLTDLSRNTLENYISASNGFRAIGSTYHDFGMIWGGRFISPEGIFASENATAPNGDAIARHIIFMTDGDQSTANNTYALYGTEWWDRRVTDNGSSNIEARHAARFQAACRQARQNNISVWVVAFGTALTQNLIDCASSGRAFSADNDAELASAFEEIAQKIAALRLTS